jgi:hypothetical protein
VTRKREVAIAIVASLAMLLATAAATRTVLHAKRLRQLAPFTARTRSYFERALAGDTVGIARMSTDSAAAVYAVRLARARPAELRLALRTLRPRSGGWLGVDTLVVFYASDVDWCAGVAGATELQVQFVRAGAGWKVYHAGPGPC